MYTVDDSWLFYLMGFRIKTDKLSGLSSEDEIILNPNASWGLQWQAIIVAMLQEVSLGTPTWQSGVRCQRHVHASNRFYNIFYTATR